MKTAKKIDRRKIESIKKKMQEDRYLKEAVSQLAHEISTMFT